MANPEEILSFWLDEVGPAGWYKSDPVFDAEIRARFEDDWNRAMAGTHAMWLTYASGTLAYIILTDQFSRNMFRDTGKAFASDRIAKAAAKMAIAKGWDKKIDGLPRQFFYMPLMHSECLSDQDRCVRLMKERLPDEGGNNLVHARAHREVIRQFGRFPTRNEALQRCSTAPEAAYVDEGGYRKSLELVSAA